MSNRVEPELPSINIDDDQLKPRQAEQRHHNVSSKIKRDKAQKTTSLSVFHWLLILIPYVALSGATWYFYQQQQLLNQQTNNSQKRIEQLENQLSATGEEMGESTIALKVKLEAISDKTELLLTEMDKLWASAWRKNQKQIKALNSSTKKIANLQSKQRNEIKQQISSYKDLSDKLTATEFSINAVSEQIISLNSIKDQLKNFSSQLTTLSVNDKSRKDQQILTATSMNELDTNLQLLLERIEKIEAKIAQKKPIPAPSP